MTRSRFLPLLALAIVACTPTVGTSSGPAPATSEYRKLLVRLQAKDTSIDFTALRLAYAASPDYAPYGSDADDHRDSLSAALARRDYRRVIVEADAALTIDYLDIRTHVLRAYASEQLGDEPGVAWDRLIAARLVQSIMQSGAGTVDSPYVVVSVAEEYALLGIKHYQSGMQSLGKCGTRPCDILETIHQDTQEKRTFHFDITLPMTYMRRQFEGKH
ncbi:MAG: hypothetical protein AUH41_13040 [Gemmatimonadetes bacterium 13_1_40CM_66_11]|nr:MAG: hypothetical protein AUH41_13040 [Gemmatimonadetes bacterium 13_1_40CM_66_11]